MKHDILLHGLVVMPSSIVLSPRSLGFLSAHIACRTCHLWKAQPRKPKRRAVGRLCNTQTRFVKNMPETWHNTTELLLQLSAFVIEIGHSIICLPGPLRRPCIHPDSKSSRYLLSASFSSSLSQCTSLTPACLINHHALSPFFCLIYNLYMFSPINLNSPGFILRGSQSRLSTIVALLSFCKSSDSPNLWGFKTAT